MLQELTLSRRSDSGAATVTVAGELDALTAPNLAEALADELARGERELLIDMSEVSFMSSAGLHVLLALTKNAAGTGVRLRMHTTGSRPVERVLEATGSQHLLPLTDRPQDA
jgi:anti-sigma B factor antagonist